MDNACVIGGLGIVGGATVKVFGIKNIYDLKDSTITLDKVARLRFCFICLPTPVREDGSYITDDIEALIKQIEDYGSNCLYIIRSTVYPGFARYLMDKLQIDCVISNPEFLSQDTAERDSKNPPFVLLGGANPNYLQEIKGLYEGRIKGAPVILTDNISAELAKIALNGFFATKVIYANTIFDIARKLGANYETVKSVFERHPFGFRNHAQVYYKGKRGVHGACLSKDTRALQYYTDAQLIKTINQLNEEIKNLKDEEISTI